MIFMEKFVDKQKKEFDKFAIKNKDIKYFLDNHALSHEFNTILDLTENIDSKNILDFGCGIGRISLKLARIAKSVIGVDISEQSIKAANENAKIYGVLNFKGFILDEKISIKYQKYFDYILLINVIHHVEDINSIFKKISNYLKDNGEIIIFEFNPLNLLFIPFIIYIKEVKSHLNRAYFRSNFFTLQKILKINNFKITYFNRYGFLPTFLYNYSLIFLKINNFLNNIYFLNIFTAFHIIKCKKSFNDMMYHEIRNNEHR